MIFAKPTGGAKVAPNKRQVAPNGCQVAPNGRQVAPDGRKVASNGRQMAPNVHQTPCLRAWAACVLGLSAAPDLSATSARLKHDKTADNANVRLKGDKAAAIASSAAQGPLRQCRWISTGAR